MKKTRSTIVSSVGAFMGLNALAARYAILGIETVYSGVQIKSTCDVLHGIEIFTNLKKYCEPFWYDRSFDLLLRTMSAVTPHEFSDTSKENEQMIALCFQIPSLLRGINPSKCLVEFAIAFGTYYALYEKVNIKDCDINIITARNELNKAKHALQEEWGCSKTAQLVLSNLLEVVDG